MGMRRCEHGVLAHYDGAEGGVWDQWGTHEEEHGPGILKPLRFRLYRRCAFRRRVQRNGQEERRNDRHAENGNPQDGMARVLQRHGREYIRDDGEYHASYVIRIISSLSEYVPSQCPAYPYTARPLPYRPIGGRSLHACIRALPEKRGNNPHLPVSLHNHGGHWYTGVLGLKRSDKNSLGNTGNRYPLSHTP